MSLNLIIGKNIKFFWIGMWLKFVEECYLWEICIGLLNGIKLVFLFKVLIFLLRYLSFWFFFFLIMVYMMFIIY